LNFIPCEFSKFTIDVIFDDDIDNVGDDIDNTGDDIDNSGDDIDNAGDDIDKFDILFIFKFNILFQISEL
jgi:hypothetical protein